ncbi:MAG: hypothetical protein E7435_04945 [Ruminococcaceae bacterium]|nr:hypothetical protein [Oscillospiraceae bacterium]
MKRKQFTFYQSFHETIQNFKSKSEKLQAYETLCDYALYGKAPEMEELKPSVTALFSMAQPVLDTARRRSKSLQKTGKV